MKTKEEIWEQTYLQTFPGSLSSAPAHWVVKAMQEYADQEKQALKDELIKKVKESNLSGLSKATVYTLINTIVNAKDLKV